MMSGDLGSRGPGYMGCPKKAHVFSFAGLRDLQTLERFELSGACGDLNLPSLPTRDPTKP